MSSERRCSRPYYPDNRSDQGSDPSNRRSGDCRRNEQSTKVKVKVKVTVDNGGRQN